MFGPLFVSLTGRSFELAHRIDALIATRFCGIKGRVRSVNERIELAGMAERILQVES